MSPRAPLNLLPPTRRLLLLGLKEQGEATAEDLSRSSFLSIAAVRMHLYALESEGFVTHIRRRDGRGRPTHVFSLTSAGEELFPQGYATVALAILSALDSSGVAKEDVAEAVFEDQLVRARRAATAANPEGRVDQLAELQENQGFFPVWENADPACWSVTFRHCPFIRLAEKYPGFCELERRVIEATIAAGPVEHVSSRARGDTQCVFHVHVATGGNGRR